MGLAELNTMPVLIEHDACAEGIENNSSSDYLRDKNKNCKCRDQKSLNLKYWMMGEEAEMEEDSIEREFKLDVAREWQRVRKLPFHLPSTSRLHSGNSVAAYKRIIAPCNGMHVRLLKNRCCCNSNLRGLCSGHWQNQRFRIMKH
jgi:hypothetical protein